VLASIKISNVIFFITFYFLIDNVFEYWRIIISIWDKNYVGDFSFLRIKNTPSKTPLTNNIQISLSIGTGAPTGGGMARG
jgi:hypothetical protein